MSLDLDDLFKTLDKGFDKFDTTMTDKSRRIEQRMEKMRQGIEKRADDIRDRAEKKAASIRRGVDKMGQTKKSRIVIDGKDLSDCGVDPLVQMFKIFIGSLKWFALIGLLFYIFITFNNFIDKVGDKVPQLSPPSVEEPVKPDTTKKL